MNVKSKLNLFLRFIVFIITISSFLFGQNILAQNFPDLPLSKQDSLFFQQNSYIEKVDIFDCKSCLKNKYLRTYKKFVSNTKKGNLLNLKRYVNLIPPESRFYHPIWAQYFWLNNNEIKAREHALKSINLQPTCFPIVYYILGEISYQIKDYIYSYRSLKNFLEFKSEENLEANAKKFYLKSKEISDLISRPVFFKPEVVAGVSSVHDEYLPAISPDQELIFYTRRHITQNSNTLTSTNSEEFTFSLFKNGDYTNGEKMPNPFNILDNEGGATLSLDNKTLYFTRCSKLDGYNNCDIFYSNYKNGKWSEIKGFNNRINIPYSWESQPSVSPDGNSIIFASDRDGGFGGIDLYIIYKTDNGWTDPKNLGEKINTSFQEKSPFLHTDGETLFFASTRFPSVGGYDLFYSRKDSAGNWQAPKNIGYPINTRSDEISLSVSTDGNRAYFASNQLNGVGGWDIYSFVLHKEARPKRVLFLKGDLVDDNGKIMRDVELKIQNLKTKESQSIYVNEGSYATSITLDDSDDVLVTVKKNGFAFNSRYISSKDTSFLSPSKLNFTLQSLESGKSFKLNNVYFETNSDIINQKTKHILTAFSSYLKENLDLKVQINGHTDDIGTDLDNMNLSKRRAFNVLSFILNQGIDKKRLSSKGFGETLPVNTNDTEEGRSQNRRTEFLILEKE